VSALDEFDAEMDQEESARNAAGERLLSILERIERIDEEVKGLRSDRTDILAEAKSAGFDVKVIRLVLARRKLDRETKEEMDDLLDMYERAIGQ
jgi:uncharacterized protein (UPF0335 family)